MTNKALSTLARIAPGVIGAATGAGLTSVTGVPLAMLGGTAAGGITGLAEGLRQRLATKKAYKSLGKDVEQGKALLSQMSGINKKAFLAPAAAALIGGPAAAALHKKVTSKVGPKDYHLATGIANVAKALKKSPLVQLAGMLNTATPKATAGMSAASKGE